MQTGDPTLTLTWAHYAASTNARLQLLTGLYVDGWFKISLTFPGSPDLLIHNPSHLPRISWSPDLQSVSPAQDLLRRIERHRKASDKKVRKCQADEEVVVDAPQLGVEDDAEDDEEVGEDGDHDDKYQDDPLDDGREVQCEMSQLMVCCIF